MQQQNHINAIRTFPSDNRDVDPALSELAALLRQEQYRDDLQEKYEALSCVHDAMVGHIRQLEAQLQAEKKQSILDRITMLAKHIAAVQATMTYSEARNLVCTIKMNIIAPLCARSFRARFIERFAVLVLGSGFFVLLIAFLISAVGLWAEVTTNRLLVVALASALFVGEYAIVMVDNIFFYRPSRRKQRKAIDQAARS